MTNRHLNIFEFYSQKGVIPIENNSTRNLAIVLKSDWICFDRILDLIIFKTSFKNANLYIEKPRNMNEYFFDIQVPINKLANMGLVINNIIGVTLTTKELDFLKEEVEFKDKKNITDIVIYTAGTIIIIEAKRNDVDATHQLRSQIDEFINKNREKIDEASSEINTIEISLTWEEVLKCLEEINELTNKNNLILNDYVEHIKKTVPSFFPVRAFNELTSQESGHIQRRIERFAENSGMMFTYFNNKTETLYRINPETKPSEIFIKEFFFQNYNEDIKITLYPGNTVAQSKSLFSDNNKLSLLCKDKLQVDGEKFKLKFRPNLKISNTYGKWIFDVDIKSNEPDLLRELYKETVGQRKSENNFEFLTKLSRFESIISTEEYTRKFSENFADSKHNYTFNVALTIEISIEGIYEHLKLIDVNRELVYINDPIVKFAKDAFDQICYWIEN